MRWRVEAEQEAKRRAGQVRALILDVDGVLTDGRLYYTRRGETVKAFFSRDGFAIKMAQSLGLKVGILSGRGGAVLRRRLADLSIEPALVVEESHDKARDFALLCQRLGMAPTEVAYMGDDVPDVVVLRQAGLAMAPADAAPEAQSVAHLITRATGGKGAVREAIVFILQARGLWETALRQWHALAD
ncbi:MAG: HAD hydrolase family protein [Thermoanaerobaculum sp.]|nr:HAD hydrolase family protein [Thermoanaerobaculum sp.]